MVGTDLAALIEELSRPGAYPYPLDSVSVRQTHISVVFLAGPYVYKVKKPINLGFLDFSSLEKRLHFCQEEVRLNRRLAAQTYLGIVPVVQTDKGLQFEGEGEPLEWAVKMQRLPEDATLHARLGRGELDIELAKMLARRIAAFHRVAETNERIASFGRFEAVSRVVLDIFAQAGAQVGTTVSGAVFARLQSLAEDALSQLRPLIEARAALGMPRDCHGDLHLDHIYHFPHRKPPGDLVIIDCIEFNERFRFIDPVADMAFATMDLEFHSRRDLARAFAEAYFAASGDEEGRALLQLYSAYRATVRGLVEGLELAEKEVPEDKRVAAGGRSRGHWLLALAELDAPRRKPCLILVAGLPGTGKSKLAQDLAATVGFAVIRSDVVRKELAGLPTWEESPTGVRANLYNQEWNDRTYAECLRRAERLLFEGQRVIIDATFREEHRRQAFLNAAMRWGVPSALLLCQAKPETVRQRLALRHGDPSDADWDVYLETAARWEAISPPTQQALHVVSTEGSQEEALSQGRTVMRRLNLDE